VLLNRICAMQMHRTASPREPLNSALISGSLVLMNEPRRKQRGSFVLPWNCIRGLIPRPLGRGIKPISKNKTLCRSCAQEFPL